MRRAVMIVGFVLGLYLLGRAVVEPFVIDLANPASYRHDWGGPSLLGVLVVHCGPGVLATAAMATVLLRRRTRSRPRR